ncbi:MULTISPECIES: type IV pilin protein [unclassified Prochlorococcus]|uniref:type IV pilin protein n=1 Tax=unclassified Prochlorococcus TaxID=2627481 RepID=UPI000533AD12|nr:MULTISPECIES: prepilin-type N-terminal cleavage/methylation domain-containing protein [unclassified Prochlorococcus]KGG26745.1 putative pilin [Prochlorococcus sp. MIT 0702]
MKLLSRQIDSELTSAFTLVEVLLTVVIMGILSAVALPNYFTQVQRAKQSEAVAILAQIQNTLAAYIDEFNKIPTGWAELNDIAAIMTTSGPASLTTFGSINLPGGNYTLSRTDNGGNTNYYEFTAKPTSKNPEVAKFNVIACIDLGTGASDLKQGRKDSKNAASNADLVCRGDS